MQEFSFIHYFYKDGYNNCLSRMFPPCIYMHGTFSKNCVCSISTTDYAISFRQAYLSTRCKRFRQLARTLTQGRPIRYNCADALTLSLQSFVLCGSFTLSSSTLLVSCARACARALSAHVHKVFRSFCRQ